MAIQLTTTYQKISTIYLTYGEVRTYAKYTSQSATNNTTTFYLKTTYYTGQAGGVSFSSGSNTLDTTTKSYGSTTMGYGETLIQEVSRTQGHYDDGSSVTYRVYTSWTATFGGTGNTYGDIVFPKINRFPVLVSGTNFTDATNPVYTITAYNTYALRVKLEAGGNPGLITRNLSNKGSQTYTLELTDEERKTLRNLSPDGKTLSVRETVCALSGGNEVAGSYSYKDYTMTIVKKPARIKINGTFVKGYPYVRVNGAWKEAKPYIRVSGQWKEEI